MCTHPHKQTYTGTPQYTTTKARTQKWESYLVLYTSAYNLEKYLGNEFPPKVNDHDSEYFASYYLYKSELAQ